MFVAIGEIGEETTLEKGVERDVLGRSETGERGKETDRWKRERGRKDLANG